MDIQKTVDYWLEGSKGDMKAADVLFKEKQNAQALFWCHLALEKLLKALVVQTIKDQAPYIHNLVLLAQAANLPLDKEQKEALAEISQFNIMGRYPDEMMNFIRQCTPDFTKKYYSITQTLFQWLLQKISSL